MNFPHDKTSNDYVYTSVEQVSKMKWEPTRNMFFFNDIQVDIQPIGSHCGAENQSLRPCPFI